VTKVKAKAPAPEKQRPAPKVAFPKKAQPPTHAEFAARLPAPVGKRFEALRTYLKKQGAAEDFSCRRDGSSASSRSTAPPSRRSGGTASPTSGGAPASWRTERPRFCGSTFLSTEPARTTSRCCSRRSWAHAPPEDHFGRWIRACAYRKSPHDRFVAFSCLLPAGSSDYKLPNPI
jgi:hypothetical protein